MVPDKKRINPGFVIVAAGVVVLSVLVIADALILQHLLQIYPTFVDHNPLTQYVVSTIGITGFVWLKFIVSMCLLSLSWLVWKHWAFRVVLISLLLLYGWQNFEYIAAKYSLW